MVPDSACSPLVALLELVSRMPMPPAPPRRGRGRPVVYSDRLFLQGLVVMLVRRLETVPLLVAVLHEPTPEMEQVRTLLAVNGRLPHRRTWERRMARVPDTLPAQIGCLGRFLVGLLGVWAEHGRAVVLDSTLLRAFGGVWHVKDRIRHLLPPITLDVEADWGKSGWHGWVYGWKLHLAATVAGVWLPLAADLTQASVHDLTVAPALLRELPLDTRYVLGDAAYQSPDLHACCHLHGRTLIASRRTPAAATDPGKPVRALFHALRSTAVEPLNELLKDLFGLHGAVPTTGLLPTKRYVLGAIFVYQLALWYRFEQRLPLQVGMKPFLRAA